MTDEKDGTTVWDHDAAGGDETEIVNPVLDYDQHRETEVAPTAWSDYQEDDPPQKAPQEDPPTRIIPREGSHSWRRVGLIAAVIFIPLTAVAVMIIGSRVHQLQKPPVVGEPLRVVTVPPAAPPAPAPAAVPPPVTVIAPPPPVTVTQTPEAAPPPPVIGPKTVLHIQAN